MQIFMSVEFILIQQTQPRQNIDVKYISVHMT